jgi:hypothetical protein
MYYGVSPRLPSWHTYSRGKDDKQGFLLYPSLLSGKG